MKNLQYLFTELFKVKNGLSREIVKCTFVFQENETYNLTLSGPGFLNNHSPEEDKSSPYLTFDPLELESWNVVCIQLNVM